MQEYQWRSVVPLDMKIGSQPQLSGCGADRSGTLPVLPVWESATALRARRQK